MKDYALTVGLYPEGNILGYRGTWDCNGIFKSGDAYFIEKLAGIGVPHITALNSIVYHFGEGEMTEGL